MTFFFHLKLIPQNSFLFLQILLRIYFVGKHIKNFWNIFFRFNYIKFKTKIKGLPLDPFFFIIIRVLNQGKTRK